MRICLLTCLLLFPLHAIAAPKADLWVYWQTSNEANFATIDHQAWQQLLTRYLTSQGQHHRFDYANVSDDDTLLLASYLTHLATLDPRQYAKAEQYAYWVNLYNALTVKVILDNYPIRSITKLGGWFSFGPWDEPLLTINGHALSLNDIEHRILRPIWQDPRTHYVINCASLGCPNLPLYALTRQNAEEQLDQAAKTFINSPKGISINGNQATLSSVYQWFSEDFGGEASLFDHIGQYAPQYQAFQGKIRYDYDWDLNQRE